MPNISISLPADVVDQHAKTRLVDGINAVAVEVEQIGDDPKNRFLCWVVINEVAEGNWTCGGLDVTAQYVPILVIVHLPVGVLDGAARARYAHGVHRAVTMALAEETRRLLISCVFNEVEDGAWGVNGAIWNLKDFAKHAGFMHLQHLKE